MAAAGWEGLMEEALALLARGREAVLATLEEVRDKNQYEAYKKAYQTKYPSSQIFFTLQDFHFFEMNIEELYYVGGFGKIQAFK